MSNLCSALLAIILGLALSTCGCVGGAYDDYEDEYYDDDYDTEYDDDDDFDDPWGMRRHIALHVGIGKDVEDFDDVPVGGGGTIDLSDHGAFGLEYSTIGANGFGFETGIFYSEGDDTTPSGLPIDFDLELLEFTIGGRYTYTELGDILPYIGAGLDLIFVELEGSSGGVSAEADDEDFGAYVHVGVNYVVPKAHGFTIGMEGRALFGTDDDLDYTQFAIVIGVMF